jgi:hypothetical protein
LRRILVLLVIVLLAVVPLRALAEAADVESTVEAEGSAAVVNDDLGRAEDEALADAKKNAVEQGIGVFVKSESVGKNYEAVTTILTHSEGYISSWSKIEGSRKVENVEGSKLLTIKISAKVKLLTLVNALSDIESIYEAIQRPKVMVLISEKNLGQPSEGLPASATALMRALGDRHFDVVDPEVVRNLLAKESARAVIERGDAQAAALLAMKEGAEILVLGTAQSTKQDVDALEGVVSTASAILTARIVYADTGDVLYTSQQVREKGASTSSIEEAGLQALDKAGTALLESDQNRFADQVIARWAREAQNGRTYKVTADGVTYSELNALKRVIGEFRGHVGFTGGTNLTGGTGAFSVKSKLTLDDFRDRLEKAKVNGKTVEITNVSGATTNLVLKGKPKPKGK